MPFHFYLPDHPCLGQLKGFTGIDDPYEEPDKAELVIEAAGPDGVLRRPEDQAVQILTYLRSKVWGGYAGGFSHKMSCQHKSPLLSQGFLLHPHTSRAP